MSAGMSFVTLWDLIRSMIRRWPVILLGVAVTLAATYGVTRDRGVYWTRTEVVFLAPPSAAYPNSLKTTSEDLIVTAGAVAKAISGPAKVVKLTSPDAGLIGLGVRSGWAVRLPDDGGQWAPNFEHQWLIVEVVGPDAETVRREKDALVGRIAQTLSTLQEQQGVLPKNAITTTAAPNSTVAYRVIGSGIRARAMTLALGGAATLWVALMLELRAARRPARRVDEVAAPIRQPVR
jgi:hypothetical protein